MNYKSILIKFSLHSQLHIILLTFAIVFVSFGTSQITTSTQFTLAEGQVINSTSSTTSTDVNTTKPVDGYKLLKDIYLL